MVWWIVGALVALAVVLLLAALGSLRRRLPLLARARARLQRRVEEAAAMTASLEPVQARLATLQRQAAAVRRRPHR